MKAKGAPTLGRVGAPFAPDAPGLEVQLEAELELTRVEGGGWDAVVAPRPVALVEGGDVRDEGRGCRLVKAVEEVEALGDDVEAEALAEADGAREAQVERHVAVRD